MLIRFFLTFLILVCYIGSYSQELPDSLKSKLSGKSSSEQVSYLNSLVNQQLKSSPAVAFQLAKISLNIKFF